MYDLVWLDVYQWIWTASPQMKQMSSLSMRIKQMKQLPARLACTTTKDNQSWAFLTPNGNEKILILQHYCCFQRKQQKQNKKKKRKKQKREQKRGHEGRHTSSNSVSKKRLSYSQRGQVHVSLVSYMTNGYVISARFTPLLHRYVVHKQYPPPPPPLPTPPASLICVFRREGLPRWRKILK